MQNHADIIIRRPARRLLTQWCVRLARMRAVKRPVVGAPPVTKRYEGEPGN
jgi:hypothetical protein